MRQLLLSVALIGAATAAVAQTDNLPNELKQENEPLDVTNCELFRNPQKYAGRLVRFRAGALGKSFNDLPILPVGDENCGPDSFTVLAVLPSNIRPVPPFQLVRNEVFETFENSIDSDQVVFATFEGRFDPVFTRHNGKRIRIREGLGYGKNHRYDARLVIHRIRDVYAGKRLTL